MTIMSNEKKSGAPPQADDNSRLPYDQVLRDITTYVFEHKITSPKAWLHARVALLDSLGCAMKSLKENPDCARMIGPVVPGTIVPNGFKLPGTNFQLDPIKGAFDLGAMIRYLDISDAYPGAEWGHPSDNIGAILAVADWQSRTQQAGGEKIEGQPPMTMETVLIALIKAYEIQGCFQLRNAFNKVGLDHTILVKIGSTAVVSWMLGLSEKQTLDALSQAWMDGHPLRTFRQSPNTGPRKGWAAGDACMRAVHLALLTKHGQPGAPTVLTAPRWGFYDVLFKGKEFQLPRPFANHVIENIFFKLVAAEGHGIAAVEAAVQVGEKLKERDISAEKDIEKINVRTQEAAMIIINKKGDLHNAADRDHCMQYMIAVILLKGSVIDAEDYENHWAHDARVEALRQKIELVEDPQFTKDYHDPKSGGCASALLVTLNDGTKLDEVVVHHPLGHPWRNDTPPAVQNKFRKHMAIFFPESEIENIIQETMAEDFLQVPVSEFVDKFVVEEA